MNQEWITRIDNRLIHGQVGVTWAGTLNANIILVVDDLVAHDVISQKLMSTIVRRSGTPLRFFTVDDFKFQFSSLMDKQKIFLVLRSLEELIRLIDAGVPLYSVNIGNIHYSTGRKQLTRKVYVNARDIEIMKTLLVQDVELFIQDVPGSMKTIVTEKMLNEITFED